ncbi:helix-turn-helix domain-containing protein [Pseudomonas anguilliseptica]|jgi:transcriptional regulator with XRE-family HTH domain|uniref:helix-turn-helix domain-containing protein n=1 Tax=Pseudomonas anguilliseptica TaxID=53406 RepID=UPI003734FF62
MELKQAIGQAFKELRVSRGLPQEAAGASQSYISDVERGLKSPTIEKFNELATNIGVHPLIILAKGYLLAGTPETVDELLTLLKTELCDLENS